MIECVCVCVCVCLRVCENFSFIHYNKYNIIIEHVSTPVPTTDNSIYKYTYIQFIHV